MRIYVCVKQVPDTSGKVAVKADGTLDRASMQTIINPDDLAATEAALELKDATGCQVTVVTMGPPPAEGMLRELIAMGADDAVLISGREFGGSDTFATFQKLFFGFRLGVGHFAEHKSVHQRQILAQHSLIQAGFIAAAVAVGRGRKPEHGVRGNKLAAVFRDAQGLSVKDAVQPCGCGWFEQIKLVYQGEPTVLHRQGQRAILEFHAPLTYNVMADEFRELQPAVAGDFENRKIQFCRQLFQATGLSRTTRSVYIERIAGVYKPDDHIATLFVKDVIGVNSGSEQRRRCVAFDHSPGRRSAEHGSGVEVRDLQRL